MFCGRVADDPKWMEFEWTALAERIGCVTVGPLRPTASAIEEGKCGVERTHKLPPSAMASAAVVKKAFTLPPTVRTLASGVPSASFVNLRARAPAHDGHHDGHGSAGPRSDVPAKFAAGFSLSSSGLTSKTYFVRACAVLQ